MKGFEPWVLRSHPRRREPPQHPEEAVSAEGSVVEALEEEEEDRGRSKPLTDTRLFGNSALGRFLLVFTDQH